MTERIKLNLDGNMSCGLEGDGDCKNNPYKYPDNHRPALCRQCPINRSISKVAELPLSPAYIEFKKIQNSSLDYKQNIDSNNRVKKLIS